MKKIEENKGVEFRKNGEYVTSIDPVLELVDFEDRVEVTNPYDTYTVLKKDYDVMKYYPLCEYCGRDISSGDCGDYDCELKRKNLSKLLK